MRVASRGRARILLLVLVSLAIGTCETPIVAPKAINPPTINTTSLPEATVGESYSHSLSASGGDGSFTWSKATGNLPSGLDLSAAGVISGTPVTAATSSFTVQVASAGLTDSKSFELSVTWSSPEVTAGPPGAAYQSTRAERRVAGWSTRPARLPARATSAAPSPSPSPVDSRGPDRPPAAKDRTRAAAGRSTAITMAASRARPAGEVGVFIGAYTSDMTPPPRNWIAAVCLLTAPLQAATADDVECGGLALRRAATAALS
mgnify:CR=1 FL=1